MTELLYRRDPYLAECDARVSRHTPEGGIIADRSIFFPQGGGQPGDSGLLSWPGGRMAIATTLRQPGGEIVLVPAAPGSLPPPGIALRQHLDWERRYRHMRMHTALHLLSVLIARPVTGGVIGAGRGRLDFEMSDPPPPPEWLEEEFARLISADLAVRESWISEAALAQDPGLAGRLSIRPPEGQGHLRLIAIGEGEGQIDLQPCGGTHVARTGEIGLILVEKIEKKGRTTRRITLRLDG